MKNRTIFSDVAILLVIGLFTNLAYYLYDVNFFIILLFVGFLVQIFNIAEMLLTFYFTKFRLYAKNNCYHIDQKIWAVPILPLYFDSGYKFLLKDKDSALFQINKMRLEIENKKKNYFKFPTKIKNNYEYF